LITNVSVECEGFLFQGLNAEQRYNSHEGFKLVSSGGYFNSLPNDPLKLFIDALAEAQRALGFENEKDHPEVAPSQFELNYTYCEAVMAADLVQLYKLVARQVAANMGFTASFIPKPVSGINGSGLHCNLSVSRDKKNIFYDAADPEHLSGTGWQFIDRILSKAQDLCLVLNPSVNAYRRLDPHFEAPNQIKASAIDRTAMIRVPAGNEKSARIEVRSVAPDANPYLAFLMLLTTGLEGPSSETNGRTDFKNGLGVLPDHIYQAVDYFQKSEWVRQVIGKENQYKYINCKLLSAHRCPRELGSLVKTNEVLFHHEVVNQYLWSNF
jgi:glutamine synthetase